MNTAIHALAYEAHRSYLYSSHIDKETDTEFTINKGPSGYVVAIRGTELTEAKDIKTDLEFHFHELELWNRDSLRTDHVFLMRPISIAYVHYGFHKAAQAVFDILRCELPVGAKVVFTGHSLGGAVALIAAALAMSDGHFEVPAVVTFGCPRPGDAAFRNWLQKKTNVLRYVNAMDSVTVLPPFFSGYRQVGSLRYMNARGMYREPNILKRAWLRICARRGPISAHSMKLYLERVRKFEVGYINDSRVDSAL